MGKNKRNTAKYVKENKIYLIPICLIVAIVPIIVRLKRIHLDSHISRFWTGNFNYDFFSYYKSKIFIILVIIAIIINLFNKNFKFKDNKILYISSSIYIISIIISSVLSKNSQITFWGFPDRYEGLFVLISYIIIMILTYNLINSYNTLSIVIKSLYFSSIIIGIIGFFQYFNMDFFNTDLGKNIIVPSQYSNIKDGLKFTLGERAVYGTLYNTNYMGSFMAMLFPLTFVLAILNKNKVIRIILVILSYLFLFNLVTCHSRAGILGLTLAFIILIIFFRTYIINYYKVFFVVLIGSIILIFYANKIGNNYLFSKIETIFSDIKKLTLEKQEDKYLLKNIECEENKIKIEYKDVNLYIQLENNEFKIFDENNNILNWTMDINNGKLKIEDDRYEDKSIYLAVYENKPIIQLVIGTAKLNLTRVNNTYKILKNKNEYYDITSIEKIGFEGKESVGSERGYIWSRTLPLIKRSMIFGYGPDNFAICFPQNDVVGKINAYGNAYILVDKAHNMYLQTLVNTGLISFIALIIIFLYYIIQSFKAYIRSKFVTNYEIAGISIFLGIIAYLVAGFFNDSVISVAPVFWVLLGAGFAVNDKVNGKI